MDTIANMLTVIINAQRVGKQRVALDYSRFKESLARLLKDKELVADYRIQESDRPKLIVTLSYDGAGQPRIAGVRRISKPGQRIYVGSAKVPYSHDGMGSVIISTSQGLMDDRNARKLGLGGELVCEIW